MESPHSEATAGTSTVPSLENYYIVYISDGGDRHHPTPTPGSSISPGRRFLHVTRHSEIRIRRRRSPPTAAGRGPRDALLRPRRPRGHIFNYATNALILLLSPYASCGVDGRRPQQPAMKVFTIAALLSFALAWTEANLGLARPRSRAALVIRVLAAASAVVMFSANGWLVVPREHRWLACTMGVFLSICLLQHCVHLMKEKIWAFVARYNTSDMIPAQS